MALVRYTALRFLVFAVVVALLWIFGLRGFWLLLAGVLLSGFVSLFALNRSRDELSSAYVQRREKIKRRMAERAAAEDAWNDEARGTSSEADNDPATEHQRGPRRRLRQP